MKNNNIHMRVSNELKNWLEKQAARNNTTVSGYITSLITDEMYPEYEDMVTSESILYELQAQAQERENLIHNASNNGGRKVLPKRQNHIGLDEKGTNPIL
jgi:hypothetical protein